MRINCRILHFFFIVTLVLNLISCKNRLNISSPNVNETKRLFPNRIDTSKFLKQIEVINYIKNADIITPSRGQNVDAPFDTLEYNKVIAYDFEGNYELTMDKSTYYSRASKMVYKQKSLSQNQINNIVKELTNKKNYGDATAACFEPHMALVFFKDTTIVNSIDICMDCNYLISTHKIPNQFHNKVNAGKEDEYSFYGFTNKGKRMIKKLSKELGFNYANFKIN